MISAAFTNRFAIYLPIIIIITIGAFLRLYKIDQAFPFDHDQEVAALAAFDFFIHGKLTLIGQELSFGGFFLGPVHNWVGFIPYGICNLQPDCVPYFYTAIGLLTAIIIYSVAKAIFDTKAAFVAGLIYATSFVAIGFERGVSSNYFLILSSVAIFYCLYKYFKGSNFYLVGGAAIVGLATVNFNPVFIFSSSAFFLSSLLRRKKDLKIYILAILAFLLNYLPLVIFNFRHDNILAVSLNKFIAQNAADFGFAQRLVYLLKDVSIPFYSNFLFQSASLIFLIITSAIIIFGLYYILRLDQKFLLFIPIWITTTIVGFIFYRGPVGDYYFIQTLLPITIAAAIFTTRNILFFVILLSILMAANFASAQNYSTIINYQVKKQAVDYIISDSNGESFNVYYDLPTGFNTGYSYLFRASEKDRTTGSARENLFKAKGHQPQEGGENLYIIELASPQEFDLQKYQSTFGYKSVQAKTFGYLYVVSVK